MKEDMDFIKEFRDLRDRTTEQYQRTIERLTAIETKLEFLIENKSKSRLSKKQIGLLVSAITALASAISVAIGSALK